MIYKNIFTLIKDDEVFIIKDLILNNKINVDTVNSNKETLLIFSSRLNKNEIIDILLQNDKILKTINKTDLNNNTALHYAVLNNNIGIVKKLIKNNIDSNILNDKNESALFFSCLNNNKLIFDYLLDNHSKINYYTVERKNILYYSTNDLKFFIYVSKKFNFNLNHTDIYHNNILYYVIKNNNFELLKYLFNNTNINRFIINNNKENLLFEAIRQKNIKIIKFLIDQGLSLNIKNINHETLFDLDSNINNYLEEIYYSKTYQERIKKYQLQYMILEENIEEIKKIIASNKYYLIDDFNLNINYYLNAINNKEIINFVKNNLKY